MTATCEYYFLTVRDVAARYRVSVNTVWRWTLEREGFPKPWKLGKSCTRWRSVDLDVFEQSIGPKP